MSLKYFLSAQLCQYIITRPFFVCGEGCGLETREREGGVLLLAPSPPPVSEGLGTKLLPVPFRCNCCNEKFEITVLLDTSAQWQLPMGTWFLPILLCHKVLSPLALYRWLDHCLMSQCGLQHYFPTTTAGIRTSDAVDTRPNYHC